MHRVTWGVAKGGDLHRVGVAKGGGLYVHPRPEPVRLATVFLAPALFAGHMCVCQRLDHAQVALHTTYSIVACEIYWDLVHLFNNALLLSAVLLVSTRSLSKHVNSV